MKVNQKELISELNNLTDKAIGSVNQFKNLTLVQLNYKHSQNSWSVLECIEHLNLYGKFYLPEIEKVILLAQNVESNNNYKSSLLGDFFVNSIKAENKKKMKATLMMTPQGSELSYTSLDMFLKQLERLSYILKKCENKDLIKVKTSISLTKFLKLRLGDTLRFLVYHNERHILQAENVLKQSLKNKTFS
jgi:hypothetical protein